MSDRTKMIKRLLTATVVVSVGLVVWIFVQFRQQHVPPTMPLPEKASASKMTLSKVHHTATKDGAIQWKLEASSAELEANSDIMVLQNPLIDFYLEDGSRVNLQASKGKLNTKNNDLEVNGNVSVVDEHYTFKTEALAYQHQKRLLQADTPIDIIAHSFNLKAATMIYDLNAKQATFDGDIRGTIHEKPST